MEMTMDDEFSMLADNASEVGLPWHGRPAVARTDVELEDGRTLSAIVWGDGPPEMVLLHGGAQNAHTWDTVALALDRPLVAIDLPGHGRSSWREDGRYTPAEMAADVAHGIRELAPAARMLVGMSLGGITAIALTARFPELVHSLVLVDVTPGVNAEKAAAVVAFVSGPPTFASFDELLARTIEHNPTRSESSLRRGILHNALELPDGTWAWRHHLGRGGASGPREVEFATLWDDLSTVSVPLMLVRGGASPVVDDDDVAELRRRQPAVRVEVVEGAGHSIQGDRPLELAALLASHR
jgi:pimeloyl-ACP methyl ester carboxylesterase